MTRGLLHHQVKLFLAFPTAGVILLASGTRAQVFSSFLPGRFGAIANAILTVFWITAITASFSILDYMDGLCAGIAAIASLFIAILAVLNGQVLVGTLAAAVVGAALGFLRWNFSPARMFMGDGGAMFLGFLVATLALKLRVNPASQTAAWLAARPHCRCSHFRYDSCFRVTLGAGFDSVYEPWQGPHRSSSGELAGSGRGGQFS